MNDNTLFHFELISPEKKLVSEKVYQVTAPGTEGDFGVLAGHMLLLTTLRSGTVEVIRTKGAKPERYIIEGGFADVTPTSLSILAEKVSDLAAAA